MTSPTSLASLSRRTPAQPLQRRIPAWIFPAAILCGFTLLFLALFRDRILPAKDADVAIALAAPLDGSSSASASDPSPSGGVLFQASGWIEPDPLPFKATALIDGVVETVSVLEGQEVKKGDPLATLIRDDAELALAMSRQNRLTAESSRDAHVAAIASARERLNRFNAIAESAAAARDEADDRLARLDRLSGGAVSQQDIVSARLRLGSENANANAASFAAAEANAEIKRLELETRVLENKIQTARIEEEKAELAVSRTVITAPADGRVLRLMAAPGQKKMLQDNEMESSTIAILYDPRNLQVRVDVPLADAAALQVGQPANIRCSLLPDHVMQGTVTRITGEADIQRNTLQAKVRINTPPHQLRPEMLCRVEFFGSAETESLSPQAGSTALAIWIPESAVNGEHVWVCDPETRRVSRRSVQPGTDRREGYIRITGALRPGEWVVLSPSDLKNGQRVNPTLKSP